MVFYRRIRTALSALLLATMSIAPQSLAHADTHSAPTHEVQSDKIPDAVLAPDENVAIEPETDTTTHDNTRAALYYALQPRQHQAQALSILFPDDNTWSRQNAWLDAVADHATKGSATWTKRRCENTLEGAQQAFDVDAENRTEHRRTQLQAAILLDAAAHCSQDEYIDLALRAVSSALPQMRETRTLPALRDALVFLASAGTIDRLRRTDTRILLPYMDALIHLHDYAALERLTTLKLNANPDVGKERLQTGQGHAQRAASYTLPINAPSNCRPILNAERTQGKTVTLRQGTHLVGCEGHNARLRYYDNESTALFD